MRRDYKEKITKMSHFGATLTFYFLLLFLFNFKSSVK